MEQPKRKFVGGLENINPENIYSREQVAYQQGDVFGLNYDFINEIMPLTSYERKVEFNKSSLSEIFPLIDKIRTYKEHLASWGITEEKYPEIFVEEITPYIDTIDEIVIHLKNLGIKYKKLYETEAEKLDCKPFFIELNNLLYFIDTILRGTIDAKTDHFASKHNLSSTDPGREIYDPDRKEEIQPKLTKEESLRRITARLDYIKELLKEGPLLGSYSYLRNDSTILPVGWEPKDEEKKMLNNSKKDDTF